MSKILKKLREFIWPLLESIDKITPKEINLDDYNWSNEELDLMLNYIEKYSENEEKRKNQVETKAAVFIGTFGISITILLNLIKEFLFSNLKHFNNYNIKIGILFFIVLAIIYLCRSVWFSIKTLERRIYHTFGFPEFMLAEDKIENKKKQIIIKKYNNAKKNQEEINLKVDYMTMAQAYFKRAIIVSVGIGLFIFINELVIKKINNLNLLSYFNDYYKILFVINIILILGLYILIINLYYKNNEK